MTSKIAVAVGLVAAAFALDAAAQAKPEDLIKQRKSAFAIMGFNMGSLGAMAQDKKPYNKDEAARNAQMIAAVADYPKGFFGPGTDTGDTKAKPEIWKNKADFDAKMDKMVAAVKGLPAASGDLAALKKAVGEVGGTCKACHDDYRAK